MDDAGWDDAGADAWGAPNTAKPSTPAAAAPFDDAGEPDFAGWLAAQKKSTAKAKVLPKGMGKASTAAAGKAPVVKKAGVPKKTVPAKKETQSKAAKKEEDEVEGWGDEW
ncbi:hypothetical protein OPT61_g10436 [Boeremia exigua]|uniref:Uncharacterized protein n=1 Tax=Boeremia exigua TaxID=749465 RepID=A0ACC2HQ29_9PLEO|nr:hypothetical protein OPT61_g10436 [Boeremia exigua]